MTFRDKISRISHFMLIKWINIVIYLSKNVFSNYYTVV